MSSWQEWYDNLNPYDDEEDFDCHAGSEDGCSCPKCLRDDEYITVYEEDDE